MNRHLFSEVEDTPQINVNNKPSAITMIKINIHLGSSTDKLSTENNTKIKDILVGKHP